MGYDISPIDAHIHAHSVELLYFPIIRLALSVSAVFQSNLKGVYWLSAALPVRDVDESRLRALKCTITENMSAGDETAFCHAQHSPQTDTLNELIYMT